MQKFTYSCILFYIITETVSSGFKKTLKSLRFLLVRGRGSKVQGWIILGLFPSLLHNLLQTVLILFNEKWWICFVWTKMSEDDRKRSSIYRMTMKNFSCDFFFGEYVNWYFCIRLLVINDLIKLTNRSFMFSLCCPCHFYPGKLLRKNNNNVYLMTLSWHQSLLTTLAKCDLFFI